MQPKFIITPSSPSLSTSSLSSSLFAMYSGNSSSMKSSSGGGGIDQEEYNSHTDQSISPLFNHNTISVSSTVPTQLDSFIANYFNTAWSTDNPSPPISSESFFFQQNLGIVSNSNISSPICSVPTDKKNGLNPKKRPRVSKRAPTTVLTTDTSNFRAMVQEFTGNTSTPFTGLSSSSSSSSSFPRSRLDLFKPFPQKLIPQTTTNHNYLIPPPSSDYHHLNINTQNIVNPFLKNQTYRNHLMDQSLLCENSRPLSFGNLDVGTNFEGLHNIIVSSSMTQPTLKIIHGDKACESVRRSNGSDNDLGME